MDVDVPYMMSITNLHKILNKIQQAGAPEAFGLDFLRDLGFTSSNDRSAIKLLKYLGFLDANGKPQAAYREFMDGSRAKAVLADRLKASYDDLFLADKAAQAMSVEKLKGWFKTKTGKGDAVAEKIASTFKSLATYATWEQAGPEQIVTTPPEPNGNGQKETDKGERDTQKDLGQPRKEFGAFSFAYKIEIHLPDTTNIDTYRSIFRALREELGSE